MLVAKFAILLLAMVASCTPALVGETAMLVNQERETRSLPPLTFDEGLSAVAQARVLDMWENGYLGHFNPVTGDGAETWLRRNRLPFLGDPGEVIVRITGGTEHPSRDAVRWLMQSPPHAATILGPFTHMGIGYMGSPTRHLFVVVFVQRARSDASP